MDPNYFLDTAKRLRRHAQHEGDWRSAVSRAYYSVFLTLRQPLEKVFGPGLLHEKVIKELQSSTNPDIRSLGDQLRSFKRQRADADYDMEREIREQQADDALSTATLLFQAIAEIGEYAIQADARSRQRPAG